MPTYFLENNQPLQGDFDKRSLQKINGLLYDAANRTTPIAVSTVTSTRSETFNSVTCGTGGSYTQFPNVPANEVVVVNDTGQDVTLRKVNNPFGLWILKDGYTESFFVNSNANEMEATGTAALSYKLKIRSY